MRVNCREQIANPAEPVNGQDERRKCAAVDSPARLCCSVIKRATAQDAAALCHYSERGIFHDRTRKVSRTYPAYSIKEQLIQFRRHKLSAQIYLLENLG